MNNLAPENQITWKGKSEEIKETSNELFIICIGSAYRIWLWHSFNSLSLL